MGEERGGKYLQDLPDAILTTIFGLVSDNRSRNAMSLACHKWRNLERATRRSITLRGNVRDLFLLPTCFPHITNLDLSLLSPWGYSFLHHHHHNHPYRNHHHSDEYDGGDDYNDPFHLPDHVVARCLGQAFPLVTCLTVYARTPSILEVLVSQWPGLRHVKLVRWHQRPPYPAGSELLPLVRGCSSLSSLDLSGFYCWTEDIPAALQAEHGQPVAAKSLTKLDLLCASSVEGFKSQELRMITSACPNLLQFLAPCVFDPRYHDFIDDAALFCVASNCKNLSTLHLIDHNALSAPRANPEEDEGLTSEDARITPLGLENLFAGLPMLEDLVLDVFHSVNHAGSAMEGLSRRCPRITSLKLGQFKGVCKATALHLDGVAVCGGLKSLSIKNSDLTDASLVAIARGCSRLSKFELQGCGMVSETGLRKLVSMLRETLVDVGISCCKHLDAARSLHALEPIRDRIQRLHIDCTWSLDRQELLEPVNGKSTGYGVDLDEFEDDSHEENSSNMTGSVDYLKNKKCRLSKESSVYRFGDLLQDGTTEYFRCRTWKQLKYLSLWLPVGELLMPLSELGLESCPVLEEMCMKVEGDCRTCPAPAKQAFGLTTLAYYPRLSKMKLDCGDVIGYLHTAPNGQVDLSEWERFYLNGIEKLKLAELDYWPPQDKDMNQRSLCLPAVGLLAACATLRKLFIHGTTHEHFMGMLLNIPNLRDVQLREDYYPAPENDTSTEMRVDSCRRFENALNRRVIPD